MLEFLSKILEFILRILSTTYFLVFFIAALLIIALRLWYVILKTQALSKLEYSRYFSTVGVFEGDSIELVEELHNEGFFPLLFVQLDFYVPEGLVIDGLVCKGYMKLTSIFNILPHTTVRKVHTVKAIRRDHYILETAGIKYRKNIFDFTVMAEVFVYPGRFDASAEMEPDILRAGDVISSRRYIEDPFFISGVRDYRFGDPVRNINFKATAKMTTGGAYRLMSSSYDSSRNFTSMIFLDLTPYPEVSIAPGDSENLVEVGLRYACYLFGETVANGGNIGFSTNVAVGNKKYILKPCGAGSEHIRQILESFAEITVYKRRDYSFNALLRKRAFELGHDIDIYIITPYVDEQLAQTVTELEHGRSLSFVRFSPEGGI